MEGSNSSKYSPQVMVANDCWFMKLTPLIKKQQVDGVLSCLSPQQFAKINFVVQNVCP